MASRGNIYENGEIHLEEWTDGRWWLQNGHVGFWLRPDELDELLELLFALFEPGEHKDA